MVFKEARKYGKYNEKEKTDPLLQLYNKKQIKFCNYTFSSKKKNMHADKLLLFKSMDARLILHHNYLPGGS
jgi:hypothetical protein